MNARLEDELLQLAFGELSAQDAARVEKLAASDPEAMKALETYRQMRFGLHAMPEAPPHQLSNDRLREAILRDNIKPKKQESWLGWLMAPAAVGACVFAVMLLMRSNQAAPGVGGPVALITNQSSQTDSRVAFDYKFQPELTDRIFKSGGGTVAFAEPERTVSTDTPVVENVKPAVSSGMTRIRPRARDIAQPVNFDKGVREVDTGTLTSIASKPTDDLVAPAPVEPASESIVLISNEKDLGTGAPIATEVEAADVVVGG